MKTQKQFFIIVFYIKFIFCNIFITVLTVTVLCHRYSRLSPFQHHDSFFKYSNVQYNDLFVTKETMFVKMKPQG